MGNADKEKVQLVISHLEGCSGNFLGRLFADANDKNQSFFRVDTGEYHPHVLAINGVDTWDQELKRVNDHRVVVTHNFDQQQISKSFPNAKIIQIYPYTHIGNVLYNICFKKVNNTLDNQIDNYFLHIVEWYRHIQQRRPSQNCTNFWQLNDQQQIENLIGIKFTTTQEDFFKRYWKQQLTYSLSIPEKSLTIEQLVSVWKIDNYFNDWSIAWTIFVYELINCQFEYQRLWSIDLDKFNSWEDLAKIQTRYDSNLTLPTN
jgi:hypothetical protein